MTATDRPSAYRIRSDRHGDLCKWLLINDVKPSNIPYQSVLLVQEDGAGYWTIRRDEYLRNQNGDVYLDSVTGDPALHSVVSELMFDPPMHWLESYEPAAA